VAAKESETVFPRGDPVSGELGAVFSGNVWLKMLVPRESDFNCPIGNVTFAPGVRNNWHMHAGGQILLVTDGRGWYQEEGKPARELHRGDVVMIPANVKHWHGAAKDSWFTHLSVETNISAGPAKWFGPVSDEEYAKLRRCSRT
jgi:quercetin dioxygenase-like cupin family protein